MAEPKLILSIKHHLHLFICHNKGLLPVKGAAFSFCASHQSHSQCFSLQPFFAPFEASTERIIQGNGEHFNRRQ
jgi:hypothetical protein